MMQLLPLTACSKYNIVQMSHQALEHECLLVVSPWQPTFGPYELICFHGTIGKGHQVCVLVKNGSTHNLLNYMLVKKT